MHGAIAGNGEAGSPTPRKWPKSRYLDDKLTNCRASSQAPLGFGVLRCSTSSNPWSRTTTYTQFRLLRRSPWKDRSD